MGNVGRIVFKPGRNDYYAVEPLAQGMASFNETLIRICQERAVECVDLASALPKDATIFYDDAHFNENGARRVAEILAAYLGERPPFADGTPGAG